MPKFNTSLNMTLTTETSNQKALSLKLNELQREAFRIFGPQVKMSVSNIKEMGETEIFTQSPGEGVKNF